MLFSRRAIQQMLDENSIWLTRKSSRKHVTALNNPDEPTPLAWVWEVAVLNGLSKFVTIDHEPELGSRPDIVFQIDGETVIADITVISDKRRHLDNPVDELNDEFMQRLFPLVQAGLTGGFSLSIGEVNQRGTRRDKPRPKLHIPPMDRFKEVIFTLEFDKFLDTLKLSPNEIHRYTIKNRDCDLTFMFNPIGSGWTLNKARYTQSTIIDCNPLWYALDDKRQQLEKVGLPGHRGIIVCDGDCETINNKGDWDQYGENDIINEFLRDHKSVEFVLTLVPTHMGFRLDLCSENHRLIAKLYQRVTELPLWLVPIRDFPSRLPQIQNTAQNARYQAEWKRANKKWDESPSFRGDCIMSRARIKLSARDLLALLAGVLRQDVFEALPFMARQNPFLNKLRNGQLITSTRIEKDETDSDDDWIVFEFGDPDPAVSPFRMNKSDRDMTAEP